MKQYVQYDYTMVKIKCERLHWYLKKLENNIEKKVHVYLYFAMCTNGDHKAFTVHI